VEHMLLLPRNIFNYFQLYEIKNAQGKFVERRWKLTDRAGKIYLKGNIGYTHTNPAASEMQAKQDTAQVMKHILLPYRYQVVSVAAKWRLDLLNEMNNVIATGNELFNSQLETEAARDEIIAFIPNMKSERDSLLGICIPGDCSLCGEEDPYSFRLTLVLNGEVGLVNTDIVFRRFAEKTIREEVPAHLGVKICWVSSAQFKLFEEKYCTWLQELAKEEPDATALHQKFEILLIEFKSLKNVYPKATLHDCAEGDDENRVLLGQTVIISDDDIEC